MRAPVSLGARRAWKTLLDETYVRWITDRVWSARVILQPMSGLMASEQNKLPVQYRARAQEARERAALATDKEKRKLLLHDAELWEKMAEYEEKANSLG